MVILSVDGGSIWRWQVWGHPATEFAAFPGGRDMFGREVYSRDDYSGT